MKDSEWLDFFEEKIKSSFPLNTAFNYSEFTEGDLGDIKRIEFESGFKVGTIDLWSSGWVGIDIFNIEINEQVLNILCPENEKNKILDYFYNTLEIINAKY